ncbi:molybdopterin-guanine dinucleotide biosynthesis protein MobC [Lelliottia aquatilis]|uniref:MobC family replication-relaxation protein n=1 Tax=Lelliottia aquatilis TaxID=2080838 RepID=UPI0015750323|nr:MobC family replication-relaxation protein [Lelliottia aquatilis]NTZ47710.1 molybdopterin-guanine dinucleotide biosynthesis protein MobC [Lelliottia aquatilis]
MLLNSAAERRERHHEKIRILLNFLKEETYSDFSRLMMLFEFKDHKSLYTLLTKVTKMGLIQKHVMESHTMKLAIWGITNDGLAVVLIPEDEMLPARFEPYKLTGWTLDHHLDNQLARLILEKKGATSWINGDRQNFLSRYKTRHRPDGLLTLPGGKMVAIETERRLKTKARYQSIMASHLIARTEKYWTYVFYIVPDEQKKRALIMHFDSIKHVIVNGNPAELEARHRNIFRFYTIDELTRLDINDYK